MNKKKIENPIPITIISGFLGSGKTSLLTHILSSDHGKKIAVLVNDFGSLNIDAEQISTIEGETISLTNGCICCTIRDDLLSEVLRLFEKDDIPDHIIIEASGVSDPTLIAHTFLIPALHGVIEVDSIISMVDADKVIGLDDQFKELAQRQIKVADLILINKIDLVSKSKLQDIHTYINNIADITRILETIKGQAPLSILLGTGTFDINKVSGLDNKISSDFESWIYQSNEQFTFMGLRKAIEDFPSSIYRVKGFIHLESTPERQGIFQMTGGRAWLRLGKFWNEEERKTRLVFIAKKGEIDSQEMNDHFRECQKNYSRQELVASKPIVVKNMKALSIVFG